MELMSIRMFMEVMANNLMPDSDSPYYNLSLDQRIQKL